MLSNGPPSEPCCRIVAKASARLRKVAETSPGMGNACSFWVSEVSTWERIEKKVERSGRRGGGWFEGCLGTLCSTGFPRGRLVMFFSVMGEVEIDLEAYFRKMP